MLRRNKAFTLIELLVVISIIALLVSILMPALAKAKEQAERAVDLTHIRGMTTAWLLYADENDNCLVPARTAPMAPPPAPYIPSEFEWDLTSEPGFTEKTWTARWNRDNDIVDHPNVDVANAREAAVILGILYPYVEELGAYLCPTVKTNDVKSSYSIIDTMNGADISTNAPANGHKVLKKLPEVPSPSERIVFVCEGPDGQTYGQSWTPFNLRDYSLHNNPITMNTWDWWPNLHNNGSVFSFADGHADYHQWEDPRTVSVNDYSCNLVPAPQTGNADVRWIAQYGWGVVSN